MQGQLPSPYLHSWCQLGLPRGFTNECRASASPCNTALGRLLPTWKVGRRIVARDVRTPLQCQQAPHAGLQLVYREASHRHQVAAQGVRAEEGAGSAV